ncbi:MAG: c-type cytochrome domain-containing protein [Verrucomicrobiota bacterium]
MAEPEIQIPRRRKPWALTFFGLIAAGGLVAMPFLAGPPDGDKMPDMVRFLGHFHPVLLHLPIGVFALIVMQELGAIFGRRHHEKVANPALFPLFFGAASSVLAVLAGFFLYQGTDDYAESVLAERHLWGGIIFAAAAIVTFIVKAWTVACESNPAYYRLLLFGSVSIMGFASHDGATITHGEGYLTQYAPDPVRVALGMERKKDSQQLVKVPGDVSQAIQEAKTQGVVVPLATAKPLEDRIVYTDVIAPILENRCVQCHKASKAKGKLRMDTYELLLKGGKEGPGIEPGNAAESNILVRIALPEDDEEHMPPENKPQMEAGEVELLKWWIDNGADPTKAVKDFEVPAPLLEVIKSISPATASAGSSEEAATENPHGPTTAPDEALVKAVEVISKDYPGALSFEAQGSDKLTFTAVSLRGNLDDAGFKKTAPVVSHFVTVDLSATKITDAAVAQLAEAKGLRLIRLAETGITDAAIDSLLSLTALESINLYGTQVTDAGVSKLSALPNLKRLYLWKTAVTPEAIKALQEKLPKCQIITGADA